MERLTKPLCGGYELPMIPVEIKTQDDLQKFHEVRKFYESCAIRCGQYEDSGLEPEEIADFMKRWERAVEISGLCKKGGIDHLLELKKAEQDGKLVVIPWAVGDIIYEADPAHGVVKHTFAENPAWMMHSYAEDDAGNVWYDGWGSSDETPFYKTREEAEAALAGKGDAHEADSV